MLSCTYYEHKLDNTFSSEINLFYFVLKVFHTRNYRDCGEGRGGEIDLEC
jgi:hypothetical protein